MHTPYQKKRVIYVAYVTRKDGSRDYARNHGLKAWRIEIDDANGN